LKVQKPNWFSGLGIRSFVVRRPWTVLSWASGIIAVAFIGYYGVAALGKPAAIIGQQFVLTEFPPPSISPLFYAKPITWFCYAAFLYWAFGLEAQKRHFLNFKEGTRRFLFAVTALIAFGAFYEIFFNFMLWGALEAVTAGGNPDLLTNPYPDLRNPLSLTFATKIVTLVFGMAIYSLYYLHRIDKEVEKRTPTPVFNRRESYDADRIRNIPVTRSYQSSVTTESSDSAVDFRSPP
jgi:hypothetical protein